MPLFKRNAGNGIDHNDMNNISHLICVNKKRILDMPMILSTDVSWLTRTKTF